MSQQHPESNNSNKGYQRNRNGSGPSQGGHRFQNFNGPARQFDNNDGGGLNTSRNERGSYRRRDDQRRGAGQSNYNKINENTGQYDFSHRRGGKNSSHEYKLQLQSKWKPDPCEGLNARSMQFRPVALDSEVRCMNILSKEAMSGRNSNVEKQEVEKIIQNSFNFWEEFPCENPRIHSLHTRGVNKDTLEQFINSVYPIMHHTSLDLMYDFLEYKKQFGSNPEKSLYKNMSMVDFVDRLIKKRPLSFLGANDQYLLRSAITHGFGGFEAIGTNQEKYPLVLEEYLSYDEMRISALMSMSSWSVFINNGRRKNWGEIDEKGTFQAEGVIVGQVGSRLKKEGVMEYLDCVITKEENRPEKGYGRSAGRQHINSIWSSYWGECLPSYSEAMEILISQSDRGKDSVQSSFDLMQVGRDIIFNVTVYKKRMALTAEILLCEANSRALAAGKKAYIHVVGLGLGVWKATSKQEPLFVEAWGDAMTNLKNTQNIAYVDFSWISVYNIHGFKHGQKFKNTGITVKFSERNLHDKVPDDCILVCNYAWDGNSFPGNEIYLGKVCSTGDSAAACSSQVAEIHNYQVNPAVQGSTLRIATKEGYVVPWDQFVKGIRSIEPPPNVTSVPSSTYGGSRVQDQQQAIIDPFDDPTPVAESMSPPPLQGSSVEFQEVQTNQTRSEQKRTSGSHWQEAELLVYENEQVEKEESVVETPEDNMKDIPKQIPHASIPGQMVDNPEYIKMMEQNKAANSKRKKKGKGNKQGRHQDEVSSASQNSNNGNQNKKKPKQETDQQMEVEENTRTDEQNMKKQGKDKKNNSDNNKPQQNKGKNQNKEQQNQNKAQQNQEQKQNNQNKGKQNQEQQQTNQNKGKKQNKGQQNQEQQQNNQNKGEKNLEQQQSNQNKGKKQKKGQQNHEQQQNNQNIGKQNQEQQQNNPNKGQQQKIKNGVDQKKDVQQQPQSNTDKEQPSKEVEALSSSSSSKKKKGKKQGGGSSQAEGGLNDLSRHVQGFDSSLDKGIFACNLLLRVINEGPDNIKEYVSPIISLQKCLLEQKKQQPTSSNYTTDNKELCESDDDFDDSNDNSSDSDNGDDDEECLSNGPGTH